ncbi:hypothetical protein P8452_60051 [Trifolium repens]|nr:hypothetical protein P8452_60051 [Trifolium repens]
MQKLYLDDLGNTSTNVASDVATPSPGDRIEATEKNLSQIPNVEKAEIAVESERVSNVVPESPDHNNDHEKLKEAKDTWKSLGKADPKANVVPDVPTSLAQSPPMSAVGEDVEDDVEHVVADTPVQQEKDGSDDANTDNVMSVEDNVDHVITDESVEEDANEDESTEEDVTIMKIVGASKKRGGKTGVSSILRERKEKESEVAAEATKPTKKKKVAAEATKSPKKKMYGPVRRSSRVEIPVKQKKQA